jgi:hypothetical protein
MIQFQKVVDKVRQRMSWTRSSEDLVKPSFSKSTYSSPKKKVLPIKIKSSAVEK